MLTNRQMQELMINQRIDLYEVFLEFCGDLDPAVHKAIRQHITEEWEALERVIVTESD